MTKAFDFHKWVGKIRNYEAVVGWVVGGLGLPSAGLTWVASKLPWLKDFGWPHYVLLFAALFATTMLVASVFMAAWRYFHPLARQRDTLGDDGASPSSAASSQRLEALSKDVDELRSLVRGLAGEKVRQRANVLSENIAATLRSVAHPPKAEAVAGIIENRGFAINHAAEIARLMGRAQAFHEELQKAEDAVMKDAKYVVLMPNEEVSFADGTQKRNFHLELARLQVAQRQINELRIPGVDMERALLAPHSM
ncbi:hypothetical protein [Sinorhizobium meliloti]|uniref:hypothetical protein n=1 Tax=Rhizobium meliloti TaxID=382 RepID=UPI0010717752|nr:hypothetical protein [Sinorhizobium meliloti]MQW28622.1 hypothetical protein [Sinorhizobium meliloti]